MTCLFDFLKILSCPFEGERKVKKHVVTFARLPVLMFARCLLPIERASNRRRFPRYQIQRSIMLAEETR